MNKVQQIPREQLIEGRWYAGRGRNGNVALWCRLGKSPGRLTFLTIGFTFHNPVVKDEGYYEADHGCFQPFLLLDEGTVTQPVGTAAWDRHYALEMAFPGFPTAPNAHDRVEHRMEEAPVQGCNCRMCDAARAAKS
jgi:hypothetical protein